MINLLFVLHLIAQLGGPLTNPDLDWKTRSTAHFRIHYPSELEDIASRYQKIVEPIHEKMTKDMGWNPSGPVHLVLLNNTDSANGLSTPLPYNAIYLNIAPPPVASSLDNYDDWLTMLFVHEYTHTIHIDMAEGANHFARDIFGRTVLPNAIQPQWLIEGYAIFNETNYTTQGRGRSSFVEMQLREAALQNLWPPISRATYWNNEYPYGQAAYWYGIGFYQYVAKEYGDQVWADFAKINAAWITPGWFNFKTKALLGKSFNRLWNEWNVSQVEYWTNEQSKYKTQTDFKKFNDENLKILSQGCYSKDNNSLYAVVEDEKKARSLRVWTHDENSETWKSETLSKFFPAVNLVCTSGKLLFSKSSPFKNYDFYSDLWEFDLETKKQKQLTFGARLNFPTFFKDRIFAVHTQALSSKIVEVFKASDAEAFETKVIFEPDATAQISQLRISPDGQKIAFIMKKENEFQDLFTIEIDNQKLKRITQNPRLEYFPQWQSNSEIVYTADHELPNTTSRVFNVFQQKIGSSEAKALTDTWSGIFWPLVTPNKVLIGRFEKEAFEFEESSKKALFKVNAFEKTPKTSTPPILADVKESEIAPEAATSYKIGSSLLPRFVVPISYYTERDVIVGGVTGSNDPLGFHRWLAAGYYLWTPNRFGGSFYYGYRGISPFLISLSANAGVSNYGRVLLTQTDGEYFVLNRDYYERLYGLSLAVSYGLLRDDKPLPIGFSHSISLLNRKSLISLGSEVIKDPISLDDGTVVKSFPDSGKQFQFSTKFFWGASPSEWSDFGDRQSRLLTLELEYSPKILGADFHTLTTSLSNRYFFKFSKNHSLGLYNILGIQWIDQLYQSTFRLGGSAGEGLLSSFNQKSVPFRGVPISFFRGEGVLAGSLEYQWRLWNKIPGWGMAPIWFKDFSIALFQDFGQTFYLKDSATAIQLEPQKFSFKNFSNSIGIEAQSQVSVAYGPPILFRLGYAQILYLEGQLAFSDKINEVYLQIGSSF